MHRDRLMTKIITGAEDRIRASIVNYLLKAMGIPTFPVFASQGKEQRSISKKKSVLFHCSLDVGYKALCRL